MLVKTLLGESGIAYRGRLPTSLSDRAKDLFW